MRLNIYDPRVLAIDLRFRRSGFAIFEGPRRLLDSGTIALPSERAGYARTRFIDLLSLSVPAFVVVKRERWERLLADPLTEPLVGALTIECDSRRIQIRLLDQEAMNATFRNLGCETKPEISTTLVTLPSECVSLNRPGFED